jgi:hypothetical protein
MDTKYGEAMIHQALQLKRIINKSKAVGAALEGLNSSRFFCNLSQVSAPDFVASFTVFFRKLTPLS